MKKIIEDVLQTEEKAAKVLREARGKASDMRLAVDKEISERTSEAKQQAREIVQAAAENAKEQAEQIREEKLQECKIDKESFINQNSDKIQKLVDEIVDIVLVTEYQKGN